MSSSFFKEIKKCRVCNSSLLITLLKFKPQYISSTLVENNSESYLSKVKIPMTLMMCRNCTLVQLKETTNQDLLFQNYFYRSSVNRIMRENLKDVVKDVLKKANLKKDDYIIDIGSNDCVMLTYFPKRLRRIGVEPAKNIDWSNIDSSIKIINDYFKKEDVLKVTKGKKVKAVTAIAMFYDLDNPNAVLSDIKAILTEDGVCCIQVSYLCLTVKDANFYDICHEHLEYYSLKSLNYLAEKNGLYIYDAQLNSVNGGSIRVFLTHKENKKQRSSKIDEIYKIERSMGIYEVKTYKKFNKKIKELVKGVKKYLLKETKSGKLIIGLGASTKGNVMLQICGIDKKLIPFISDRNKNKVGFKTLGLDIEVISEKHARKLNPDLMLVSPWYFKEEILEREKKYIQKGGKLLMVMPYPYILSKNGETKLHF